MFSTSRNYPDVYSFQDWNDYYGGDSMTQVGNKKLYVIKEGCGKFIIRSYETDIFRVHCDTEEIEFLLDHLVSPTTVTHVRNALPKCCHIGFGLTFKGAGEYSWVVKPECGTYPMLKGMRVDRQGKIVYLPETAYKLITSVINRTQQQLALRIKRLLKNEFEAMDRMEVLTVDIVKLILLKGTDANQLMNDDYFNKMVEDQEIPGPEKLYYLFGTSSGSVLMSVMNSDDPAKDLYQIWMSCHGYDKLPAAKRWFYKVSCDKVKAEIDQHANH